MLYSFRIYLSLVMFGLSVQMQNPIAIDAQITADQTLYCGRSFAVIMIRT